MEKYEYVDKYKVVYRPNHSVEIGSFDSIQAAYDFIDERCRDWNKTREDFDVMTIPCLKNPQVLNSDIPSHKLNLNVFLRPI